MLDFRSAPK